MQLQSQNVALGTNLGTQINMTISGKLASSVKKESLVI